MCDRALLAGVITPQSPCDLLGRGRCAMIPTADPVQVYCSSATEIQAPDLPVFKVQPAPQHTNVAMIYCWSHCAQNGDTNLSALSASVCTTVPVLCRLLVPRLYMEFYFVLRTKHKSYLYSCRQLSMCKLSTLPLMLIQLDGPSTSHWYFCFKSYQLNNNNPNTVFL